MISHGDVEDVEMARTWTGLGCGPGGLAAWGSVAGHVPLTWPSVCSIRNSETMDGWMDGR